MSMMTDQEKQLVDWMADMHEEEALQLAKKMLLEDKVDALRVLELCRMAMDEVGRRFEKGDYFLPELVLAGEMLDTVGGIAKPLVTQVGDGPQKHGKVLIGTVHGDLHDIGKNIVTFMLDINGFEVKDIGIDVPAADFISAIREFDPQIVALSGFLTLAFDSMKETIDAIEKAGLREGRKIMVGGGQIDDNVRSYTGADGFGLNAVEAVTLSRNWLGVAA